MISGAQIRAARALLGISAKELASISDVAWSTIQRYEAGGAAQIRSRDTSDRIQAALEARGIEFLGDPVESPGVRLKSGRTE